jgi:hypothetical protein
MRKLYLPFRRMRLFAFYRGISIEPRLPCATYQPFVIAFSSLRPRRPLPAAAIALSPTASPTRPQRSWQERAKSSPRMRGSVLR